MDLFELEGGELNPIYQKVEGENNPRHYSFLESMIEAAVASDRQWISQSLIKAINFHAIAGLHYEAGQYRSHEVTVGPHTPPRFYRVVPLMDHFVNQVNRYWESSDPIALSAYALWRVNHIHPFVNGNGRTARAVCYFILCVKSGGLLPGGVTLPQILRDVPVRTLYIHALRDADEGNLDTLTALISGLVARQIQDVD